SDRYCGALKRSAQEWRNQARQRARPGPRGARVFPAAMAPHSGLDGLTDATAKSEAGEQRVVVRRRCDSLYQPLHRRARWHLLQAPAESVNVVELIGTEELVLAPGAAYSDVDGRKDALLRQAAVQLDLTVAGSLEFLEDHVVHPRPRLDQRRRDDGERSATILGGYRACRAEECLRFRHRRRVEPTTHCAASAPLDRVIGTCQTCYRVQHDHDVLPELHEPAGPLQRHLGHVGVALS